MQLHSVEDLELAFHASAIIHNMCLKDEGWLERAQNPANWTKVPYEVAAGDVTVPDEEAYTPEDFIIPTSTFHDHTYVGALDEAEVETEDAYFELRHALVANFKYQTQRDAIQWLR